MTILFQIMLEQWNVKIYYEQRNISKHREQYTFNTFLSDNLEYI